MQSFTEAVAPAAKRVCSESRRPLYTNQVSKPQTSHWVPKVPGSANKLSTLPKFEYTPTARRGSVNDEQVVPEVGSTGVSGSRPVLHANHHTSEKTFSKTQNNPFGSSSHPPNQSTATHHAPNHNNSATSHQQVSSFHSHQSAASSNNHSSALSHRHTSSHPYPNSGDHLHPHPHPHPQSARPPAPFPNPNPPYLVTLGFDQPTFAKLDGLRKQYFPSQINFIPAHVSVFHALPRENYEVIDAALTKLSKDVSERFPEGIPLSFTKTKRLQKGFMLDMNANNLVVVHKILSDAFKPFLSKQDLQPYKPHVTIMNKETIEKAKAAFDEYTSTFAPFEGKGTHLVLWEYLGGPWKEIKKYNL